MGDEPAKRAANPSERRGPWENRFGEAADPLATMASLVDVMLVFACGLITALVAGGMLVSPEFSGAEAVRKGEEIPEVPEGLGESGGGGYEPVGRVYKDPKTGRLYLLKGDSKLNEGARTKTDWP